MKREKINENFIKFFVLLIIIIGGISFISFSQRGFTGYIVYENQPLEGFTNLMLQEAGTENLGDAYVRGDFANINYGTNTELWVKWGNPNRNTYVKFNMSSIPSNQIIDNASLCLYLFSDSGTQTIGAYQVYENWQESIITWNNQPCGTGFDNSINCNLTAESSLSNDGTKSNTWQCWNIINMIRKQYNNNQKNISIVLHTNSIPDFNDKFYSKEYSDSSLLPYLNITYHSANQAPIIVLASPENILYLSNESLSLNYSVSDSDGNLNSCWYNFDNEENQTIICNQNYTFNISEGHHTISIYANDSFGLVATDNVNFNVDTTGVSITTIINPIGPQFTKTGIPISFNVIGNNLTCWYNIKPSIGGDDVIGNKTLVNCSNATFDVSYDGDYVFNLYVNNTFGAFDSDSSSFSVSTSIIPPSSGGGGGGGSTTIIRESNNTINLTLNKISGLIGEPGENKKIKLKVKNIGTGFLNNCELKGFGDYFSWISGGGAKNLAAGEEFEFEFEANIPEDISGGNYILGFLLKCKEIEKNSSFNIELIDKQLDFKLIEVKRIADDNVKLIYSIEELSGIDQNVSIQFLLFGKNKEKITEIQEQVYVSANSKEEFETLLLIDSSLSGDLDLLVNLNSETYSTFVEENVVLGKVRLGGFAIFGDIKNMDNIVVVLLILLFLVFSFFIVRKIFSHKKTIKIKDVIRKIEKSYKNKNY